MPAMAAVVASTVVSACSSDDKSEPSATGATGGVGGSSGRGGASGSGSSSGATGSGGSGGSGGTAGAGDAGDLYACFAKQKTNTDPGGTAASGAACCKTFGTCTSRASAPASIVASLGKADCAPSGDLVCAPKDPATIPNLPNGKIPACTGKYGALELEGRCLPRCFTLGNKAAASLGLGDCPTTLGPALGLTEEEVLCAPCYNPLDGTATGACSQFGDAPTKPAPMPFAKCGAYMGAAPLGYCVPAELVQRVSADISLLPQDTCAAGLLCAPINKVQDPNLCFAKCESPLGGASACVPTYIVEGPNGPGMGLSTALGQVTCAAGETCTPCSNPANQSATGACNN
jgi:hypothetical protein